MTDDEARALGERWVKAGGGIHLQMTVRPIMEDGTIGPEVGTVVRDMRGLPIVWWPDLNATRAHHPTEHLLPTWSPATRGAALEVVRERLGPGVWLAPLRAYAHEDARILTGPHKGRPAGFDGWGVYGHALDVLPCERSEEGCLVAALEAAPRT